MKAGGRVALGILVAIPRRPRLYAPAHSTTPILPFNDSVCLRRPWFDSYRPALRLVQGSLHPAARAMESEEDVQGRCYDGKQGERELAWSLVGRKLLLDRGQGSEEVLTRTVEVDQARPFCLNTDLKNLHCSLRNPFSCLLCSVRAG